MVNYLIDRVFYAFEAAGSIAHVLDSAQRDRFIIAAFFIDDRCGNDIEFPVFEIEHVGFFTGVAEKQAKYIDIILPFAYSAFRRHRLSDRECALLRNCGICSP